MDMSDNGLEVGRVPSETGSRPADQAPAGLDASRFDPSRFDGQSWVWRHEVVGAILDLQEKENADRLDFKPAISRETVEHAVSQLLGIYDCRSSDFAAAYGWAGLWDILGIDFFASKLVFKPSERDGSGEAGETGTGSTEGNSPGPKDIAQGPAS